MSDYPGATFTATTLTEGTWVFIPKEDWESFTEWRERDKPFDPPTPSDMFPLDHAGVTKFMEFWYPQQETLWVDVESPTSPNRTQHLERHGIEQSEESNIYRADL